MCENLIMKIIRLSTVETQSNTLLILYENHWLYKYKHARVIILHLKEILTTMVLLVQMWQGFQHK